MDRRRFVAVVGSALVAPQAFAQKPGKVYRIGFPVIPPHKAVEHLIVALEDGLRDLGYVPGKDIIVEYRSADGKMERFPEMVQEVVRSKPDVIVTGVNASTTLVKAATQNTPIVMAAGTDVIGAGYAKSLARPGGNITGITWDVGGGTVIKRLELLKEISPRISRVVVLWESVYKQQYQTIMDNAAPALGLRTFWHEFSGDVERDFTEMTRLRADAIFVASSGAIFTRRAEITALAIKNRLPTAFSVSEFVASGGLMSYGPNFAGAYRAAARYVDKILKGAKPGDLPIEQPTVIDLTINLKTAKALGLEIPQSVLLRAERVIE